MVPVSKTGVELHPPQVQILPPPQRSVRERGGSLHGEDGLTTRVDEKAATARGTQLPSSCDRKIARWNSATPGRDLGITRCSIGRALGRTEI